MHEHMSDSRAYFALANGVTAVREMAHVNNVDLLNFMKSVESNAMIGPAIFPVGYISRVGATSSPYGISITSLDGGLQAIDWYVQHGYRTIKLESSIDPLWVKPLGEWAHSHEMRFIGHTPMGMRTKEAIADGFDELTHIRLLFLDFLTAREEDTSGTDGLFRILAERGGNLDLESPEVSDFLDYLVEKGTVIEPTTGMFVNQFTRRRNEPPRAFKGIISHFPHLYRAYLQENGMEIDDTNEDQYQKSARNVLKLTRMLHDRGIPILISADANSGFSLLGELELYVQMGFSAEDVLQMVTYGAAKILNVDQSIGVVAPGYQANLLLVEGNPVTRISDIRRGTLVIKGMKAYLPEELFNATSIEPFAKGVVLQ